MKMLNFEVLDDGLFRAKIEKRKSSIFKFWDSSVIVDTYVGNIAGWYSISTGALVGRGQLRTMLDNAARKIEIDKMLVKHDRSKIKPVK